MKPAHPAIVSLRHADKRYGAWSAWVLREVSVALEPGALVEVRGRNGSGKSTLLALLAGATLPTRGTRVLAPRARVGYTPERLVPPPPFAADPTCASTRGCAAWLHRRASAAPARSPSGSR